MDKKIKVAIAGIGNCASSFVQGLEYYKNVNEKQGFVPGLMHPVLGKYKVKDIEIVAAFDIDYRKVGKDISEAIFEKPNCTMKFSDVPYKGIDVLKAPVFDGVSNHMLSYPKDKTFVVSNKPSVNVARILEEKNADILISYMPVGSKKATEYYAEACLKSNTAFINAIPEFIVSSEKWSKRFTRENIPCIGDDIKSQIGATILHRTITKLLCERGVKIERTYQLNFGGNTDFLNMLERSRLKSKKISKTEAVKSMIDDGIKDEFIHIGPSDYVPWLNDNKICYIRIEGKKFGDVPFSIEVKLSVEDSPNSAGIMIDAVRCCKIALDRGEGGPIIPACAYFMKHPPKQIPDFKAKELLEKYIKGEQLIKN